MTNFFLGNWVTRIYLGAVVVLIATSPAPLARILLIALSAPVAVIFAPIYLLGTGWMTMPMMVLSVAAGVLLNTLLINTIVGQIGVCRAAAGRPMSYRAPRISLISSGHMDASEGPQRTRPPRSASSRADRRRRVGQSSSVANRRSPVNS